MSLITPAYPVDVNRFAMSINSIDTLPCAAQPAIFSLWLWAQGSPESKPVPRAHEDTGCSLRGTPPAYPSAAAPDRERTRDRYGKTAEGAHAPLRDCQEGQADSAYCHDDSTRENHGQRMDKGHGTLRPARMGRVQGRPWTPSAGCPAAGERVHCRPPAPRLPTVCRAACALDDAPTPSAVAPALYAPSGVGAMACAGDGGRLRSSCGNEATR